MAGISSRERSSRDFSLSETEFPLPPDTVVLVGPRDLLLPRDNVVSFILDSKKD